MVNNFLSLFSTVRLVWCVTMHGYNAYKCMAGSSKQFPNLSQSVVVYFPNPFQIHTYIRTYMYMYMELLTKYLIQFPGTYGKIYFFLEV